MSNLSQDTIDKLRALEKYILDVPERFNLAFWGVHIDPSKRDENEDTLMETLGGYGLSYHALAQVLKANPPCGTVACLAGNICIMAGKVQAVKQGDDLVYKFDMDTKTLATDYLGLSKAQGEKLFFPNDIDTINHWPIEFQERLDQETPGTKAYTQVAVDRIEHFIATGE